MRCAAVVGVEHQLKAMNDSTAARGGRAQGAGGVHLASWGSQRGGGRAGGRLKLDGKVTNRGRQTAQVVWGCCYLRRRMREFLVAYLGV